MYVEEIKVERKGKVYRSYLVRESVREGSKVKHKTIANISNLPVGCIEEIKLYLKGKSGPIDLSNIQVLKSREYGASQTLLAFAKMLQLDKLISPKETNWHEDLLQLLIRRLIYRDNFYLLENTETIVAANTRYISYLVDQLLANQSKIQNRLAEKHIQANGTILCYLIPSVLSLENEDSDSLELVPILTNVWTNSNGCPLSVEANLQLDKEKQCLFKSDCNHKKFRKNPMVIISDPQILTTTHKEEINKQGYKCLTSLTNTQIRELLNSNTVLKKPLFQDKPYDYTDQKDSPYRYIVCHCSSRKKEETNRRNSAIAESKIYLHNIKKLKRKMITIDQIVQTLQFYGTEEFFQLSVTDDKLHYTLDHNKVIEAESLDGFSVLCTDIEKEHMSSCEIINAFQKLSLLKHSFQFNNIDLKSDSPGLLLKNKISIQAFVCMLSYYLQWHVQEKLRMPATSTEFSSFREVIEKLKAIRCQTIQIENTLIIDVKSTLDRVQEKIISNLGIEI